MKTFFSDAKFILLILVAVTAVSGVSNFEFDQDQKQVLVKIEEKTKDAAFVEKAFSVSRKIASVGDDDHSQILDQSFFCNHSLGEKSVTAHSNASLIMINFKVCKEAKSIDQVNLYNESNGFVAQLFVTSPAHYKTDYIQLSSGSNKIIVEVVLKDGQKTKDSLVILTGS